MCRLVPIVLVLALATPSHAVPEGSPRAHEAYTLCRVAEPVAPAGRLQLLDRGIRLAEAAVAADATDAEAHFALFCTLGRRLLVTGFSLLRPLEALRALRALDAAVRLAPDDPDVLAAKGAVLLELPGLSGATRAKASAGSAAPSPATRDTAPRGPISAASRSTEVQCRATAEGAEHAGAPS
jgi:hypothetical protein